MTACNPASTDRAPPLPDCAPTLKFPCPPATDRNPTPRFLRTLTMDCAPALKFMCPATPDRDPTPQVPRPSVKVRPSLLKTRQNQAPHPVPGKLCLLIPAKGPVLSQCEISGRDALPRVRNFWSGRYIPRRDRMSLKTVRHISAQDRLFLRTPGLFAKAVRLSSTAVGMFSQIVGGFPG